jgi:YD repeat-containing protein
MSDPAMGVWSYAYDSNGNLTNQIDAKLQVSTMTYDRLGRLLSKATASGTTTYGYDSGANALGRLTQITDPSGIQQFFYDSLGRLIEKRRTIDGSVYSVFTTYNALGQETSLTSPDGTTTKTNYDTGFSSSVVLGTSTIAAFQYNPAVPGQLTQTSFGNNTVTTYTYDSLTRRLATVGTTNATGASLQDFTYTYDKVGNITQIQNPSAGAPELFSYDDLYRLINAQGPYGKITYNYNAVGDIQSTIDENRQAAPPVPTAWSSSELNAAHRASNVLDNNSYTRWVSKPQNGESLTVDFGRPVPFYNVVLNWEASYATSYRLQTSTDAIQWTALSCDPCAGDGNIDTISAGGQRTARFVRLTVLNRIFPDQGASLWELSVTDNKVATASSFSSDAFKAIDGDPFTRWSSTATDSEWITVYLGGLKSFDTVRLMWEAAYGKNYRIDISTNNTSWTTIKTVTNGDGNVDELYVGPQSASYVRMYGTLRGTVWGYSLWDMEVLQSSTTRTTASTENGAFPAAHAVDANPRSRWASIADDNQWLSIDWGAPKTFNHVHLQWEAAFATSYMISVSTDNTNWSIIAVVTSGDGEVDDIEVSSQTARYLKFIGVSRANASWGYSLYEMSAYWATTPTTNPHPTSDRTST